MLNQIHQFTEVWRSATLELAVELRMPQKESGWLFV